jgi:hypothetical protein
MELLVDVKDSKALHLLEVLKGISYVKTKELTPANGLFLRELRMSVKHLNLVKEGKMKPRDARELIKEL